MAAPGAISRVGRLAAALGLRRVLVTSDRGIVAAGLTRRALESLEAAGVEAAPFSDFAANPTESDAARGAERARGLSVDGLVAVGGGSSMDMAKAIGFLLAGGGRVSDYRGFDRCPAPLPPLVGVPTTAGTGSEAQSYALISRDEDHQKCACGAPSAMFRAVVLDPSLLPSAPPDVKAATGFDALAHSIESAVSTRATPDSRRLSHEAFRRIARSWPRLLPRRSGGGDARGSEDRARLWEDMQLGAFFAGAAIERSMLGAAHALANPLTRRFGTPHGEALSVTLPAVIEWNAPEASVGYRDLLEKAGLVPGRRPAETLAGLVRDWISAAGLPPRLHAIRAPRQAIRGLAEEAAREWTGTFNPRPFDLGSAEEIYRTCA